MIEANKIYKSNVENLKMAEQACWDCGKEYLCICMKLIFLAVEEIDGETLLAIIENN